MQETLSLSTLKYYVDILASRTWE